MCAGAVNMYKCVQCEVSMWAAYPKENYQNSYLKTIGQNDDIADVHQGYRSIPVPSMKFLC